MYVSISISIYEGKKIIAKHMFNKGFIGRTYKEFLTLTLKYQPNVEMDNT